MFENHNPPTVVVGRIWIGDQKTGGLLAITRGLKDGYGKTCLPGGFQEMGETWQDAIIREVLEETGIQTEPHFYVISHIESVENNSKNLLFVDYVKPIGSWTPETSEESLEVFVWRPEDSREFAFPTHADAAHSFFPKGRR